MIEFSADPGLVRPWVVCEVASRWRTAVRRFIPAMMPPPLIPAILPAEPQTVRELVGRGPAVVLWEVRRESLAASCDGLAEIAIAVPKVLQLVAASDLSDRERMLLSEFQCATVIRHPEDVPRLAPMIRNYFNGPSNSI